MNAAAPSTIRLRLLSTWQGERSSWVSFTTAHRHGATRVRTSYRDMRHAGLGRADARYAVTQMLIACAPDMNGGRS